MEGEEYGHEGVVDELEHDRHWLSVVAEHVESAYLQSHLYSICQSRVDVAYPWHVGRCW